MSAITAIYNAPVTSAEYDDERGYVQVIIKYNGQSYGGIARLHKEDKGLFSPRVGRRIAISRARLAALLDEYFRTTREYVIKNQMYREVTNCGKHNTDPTGAFYQNLMSCRKRQSALQHAIKRERMNLRKYLEGQGKAFETIHRFRNKDNKD